MINAQRNKKWAPRRLRLALLLWLAFLIACDVGGSGNSLIITGSTSVTPFAEHLAERYQHQHLGTAINIQGLGSSAGIRAALDGVAEIGMSSRELKPEEAELLNQLVIARDALAIIVHPSNPISNLSREQVQSIFSRGIRSWDEVGGAPQPIILVSREAGSGTFSAFEELMMAGTPIASSALRQGSNGSIRQIVAEDPDAIGYISLGIVDQTVRALLIENVQPSAAHVEDDSYKLVRPFLFVWRKDRQLSPLALDFIRYVMSPEGQEELAQRGLVRGEGATVP